MTSAFAGQLSDLGMQILLHPFMVGSSDEVALKTVSALLSPSPESDLDGQ